MQINRLFDASKARLDNLLSKESNLYISDAIQKAFIEVNEEGAEAAAANGKVLQNNNLSKQIYVESLTYIGLKNGHNLS